jgi:transposase
MARKIQVRPDITAAKLGQALKAPLPVIKRRRLEAMRLALDGKWTAAEIAKRVGISRAQFFNWKKQDLKDLLHIERGGGRTPRLPPAIQEEIKRRIKKGETPADVQFWLNGKDVGIKIKTGGVYYHMKKLGYRPRPKRSHGTAGGELENRRDAGVLSVKMDQATEDLLHKAAGLPGIQIMMEALSHLAKRTRLQVDSSEGSDPQAAKEIAQKVGCSRFSLYRWAKQWAECGGDLKRFVETNCNKFSREMIRDHVLTR